MHFFAVAAYGLQHPDSMNYNADALVGLRAILAEALDGRASPENIRSRVGRAADGAIRVTRRPGEALVPWRRGGWPMTIVDVYHVPVDKYAEHVLLWAHSVRETLDGDLA
jgi:hypothetical protein